MKKRKWLIPLLIAACLVVFFGYRAAARIAADTQPPEITVSDQPLLLSVQDPRQTLLQGVTAQDQRDGDVTADLVVESVSLVSSDGTIKVTYAAFDQAGNVAKAQRQAQYTDYESPKFTLRAPLAWAQNASTDVLSVISASDPLDGDITHRIRATSLSESSITATGVHDISFRVTNSIGETVELVLPLEVYQSGSYPAQLTLSSYLVYLPQGSDFTAKSYLQAYTLGTDTVQLSGRLPNNYSLQTSGEVDTNTPGVYPVSYWVTYTQVNANNSELNQTFTGYSKLIVVVEG